MRKVRRASSGSRSMRASSRLCRLSGISKTSSRPDATQPDCSRTITPRSISIRMISSTNKGLPSDFARIAKRTLSGKASISSRLEISWRLSCSLRASRASSARLPPSVSRAAETSFQPGESRSGRDTRQIRIGDVNTSGKMRVSISAEDGSAQCKSSMTRTKGRRAASAWRYFRREARYWACKAWGSSGSILSWAMASRRRASKCAR